MAKNSLAILLAVTVFPFLAAGCSSSPSPRYQKASRNESAATFAARCAANTRAVKPIQKKLEASNDEIEVMAGISDYFYKIAVLASDESFVDNIYRTEAEEITNMASPDPAVAMEYIVKSSTNCVTAFKKIKGR